MVHVISPLRLSTQPVVAPTKLSRHAVGDTSTASSSADFRAIFTAGATTSPASTGNPVAATPAPAPTAESVFGANPWLTNPVGTAPNGTTYGYNPFYFATPATAAKVAQMVGGKVVESNQFCPTGGSFTQQQPNQMVQLPDGRMINPGLVASFYTHGYSQSYVDMMVASEVRNA